MNANDTMKNGQPVEGFQQCAWEGQSMAPYSMTEPYECHEPGTVHHLGTDAPFCAHHYQKFDAKFGGQFRWAPKFVEVLCELCGHTAKEHADRYGCEHDRGDHPGYDTVAAYAMGPCGCKTFVPEQPYSGQFIVGMLDLVDEVERRVGA